MRQSRTVHRISHSTALCRWAEEIFNPPPTPPFFCLCENVSLVANAFINSDGTVENNYRKKHTHSWEGKQGLRNKHPTRMFVSIVFAGSINAELDVGYSSWSPSKQKCADTGWGLEGGGGGGDGRGTGGGAQWLAALFNARASVLGECSGGGDIEETLHSEDIKHLRLSGGTRANSFGAAACQSIRWASGYSKRTHDTFYPPPQFLLMHTRKTF